MCELKGQKEPWTKSPGLHVHLRHQAPRILIDLKMPCPSQCLCSHWNFSVSVQKILTLLLKVQVVINSVSTVEAAHHQYIVDSTLWVAQTCSLVFRTVSPKDTLLTAHPKGHLADMSIATSSQLKV